MVTLVLNKIISIPRSKVGKAKSKSASVRAKTLMQHLNRFTQFSQNEITPSTPKPHKKLTNSLINAPNDYLWRTSKRSASLTALLKRGNTNFDFPYLQQILHSEHTPCFEEIKEQMSMHTSAEGLSGLTDEAVAMMHQGLQV